MILQQASQSFRPWWFASSYSTYRGGCDGALIEWEPWIVLGVVEGLNPWKDEDHARTQEVPR